VAYASFGRGLFSDLGASMNYYEEFGISPRAGEIEIRRVYRRMVKIFHPDQYLDPEVKAIAGREMIRLNEIVRTLTDPEQRRHYDISLIFGPYPAAPFPPPSRRRRMALRLQERLQQWRAAIPSWKVLFAAMRRPVPATVLSVCLMCFILAGAGLAGMRRRGTIAPAQLVTATLASYSPAAPKKNLISAAASPRLAQSLRHSRHRKHSR
jgi:hypothetical protein